MEHETRPGAAVVMEMNHTRTQWWSRQDQESLKEPRGVCISSDTVTFPLCSEVEKIYSTKLLPEDTVKLCWASWNTCCLEVFPL